MKRPVFEILEIPGHGGQFSALLGAEEPTLWQALGMSKLISSVQIYAWPGRIHTSAVVARLHNDREQVCTIVANDAAQVQFEAMQRRILSCLPTLIGIAEPSVPATPAPVAPPERLPDAQTLAWTLAAGLKRLEEAGEAFPGRPDVAENVRSARELFKELIFALKLGSLDVEQFYTLVRAPRP